MVRAVDMYEGKATPLVDGVIAESMSESMYVYHMPTRPLPWQIFPVPASMLSMTRPQAPPVAELLAVEPPILLDPPMTVLPPSFELLATPPVAVVPPVTTVPPVRVVPPVMTVPPVTTVPPAPVTPPAPVAPPAPVLPPVETGHDPGTQRPAEQQPSLQVLPGQQASPRAPQRAHTAVLPVPLHACPAWHWGLVPPAGQQTSPGPPHDVQVLPKHINLS